VIAPAFSWISKTSMDIDAIDAPFPDREQPAPPERDFDFD
jgi:hypothetical protein